MGIEDDFRLRLATVEDVPALKALIEESVRGLMVREYGERQLEGALGYALGLDAQLIADATYFVATPVGDFTKIAACGGWSRRRTLFGSDRAATREPELLDVATEAAKIRAIFVRPQFARRGLGRWILRHCEAIAKAEGFARLEMGATLTGVQLYAREGYVADAEIEVALPNGETLAIVKMVKSW